MTDVTTTGQSGDLNSFLKTLIDSKKLPTHVKTVEDAFTIVQMGKELGFPTMQAMHYIIPVQGRLTLAAKALNALLRKGGVTMKCTEDALFVFSDGTTSPYMPTEADGKKPVDRRTTVIFTRDGIEEAVSFTWRDAELQGLAGKDNWKRMPKH